jgi:hypothetical protein
MVRAPNAETSTPKRKQSIDVAIPWRGSENPLLQVFDLRCVHINGRDPVAALRQCERHAAS